MAKTCPILALALLICPSTSNAQDNSQPPDANAPASSTTARAVDTTSCEAFARDGPQMSPLTAVCRFALTYLHQLPDFVCQQTTTSRIRTSKGTTVKVVRMQVTNEKGRERYSDISIDGKPLSDKDLASVYPTGFRSFGELGSDLVDLFRSPIAAEFHFRKNADLRKVPSAVFDFTIAEEKNTSRPLRDSQGRLLYPGFKGSLWLDRQSGQLLRLELEATPLPLDSEFRTADVAIDYANVRIANAGTFLLPIKSEATVCMTPSGLSGEGTYCTRNDLVFHDCRKFVVNSRIIPQ